MTNSINPVKSTTCLSTSCTSCACCCSCSCCGCFNTTRVKVAKNVNSELALKWVEEAIKHG